MDVTRQHFRRSLSSTTIPLIFRRRRSFGVHLAVAITWAVAEIIERGIRRHQRRLLNLKSHVIIPLLLSQCAVVIDDSDL